MCHQESLWKRLNHPLGKRYENAEAKGIGINLNEECYSKHYLEHYTWTKFMSMLILVLIFFPLNTFAGKQSEVVNIHLKDAPLTKVFEEIERQTDYKISYRSGLVNTKKSITINKDNVQVTHLLDEILKGTNISYKFASEKSIVLYSGPSSSKRNLPQQDKKPKRYEGVVKDDTGTPVMGATINVNGKTVAITDADGRFQVDLPAGSKMKISYIGLADQEITLNDTTNLNIQLKESDQTLNEVVVVGYGIQKKVNLTGSVSSVNGDELRLRPVTDASQSLQGLVPGLLVTNNNSGRPGSTGTLTIRGQGNLSNTSNPYVLVDGIEMSLSDVNPNDIESISVLKDAAACAIYGARAAYGVILVTTKKGDEGKMRINYQGSMGWSSPTVLPEMVNSVDFAHFWNDGVRNTGSSRLYSDEKIQLLEQYIKDPSSVDPWFELPANSLMNPAFENTEKGVGNVDYFKLHYKDHSIKHQHNLSFSGGGKAAQYYISGGYLNEDGILRFADINFERINVASTLTSQITKWLKLKFGLKFTHSNNKTPFGDGGLSDGFYHSLARFRPTISVIDPNGHYTELSMVPYLQSGTYTRRKRDFVNMTGGFELNPIKNLHIFGDFTYKLIGVYYQALNVPPLIYAADGVTTSLGLRDELGIVADGKYTRYNAHTHYKNISLYGNYSISIAKSHNFTIMAGYQEENDKYDYLRDVVTGLYSTSNPNAGMGTGDKNTTDTRYSWATRGFFGRLNYDYKSRYLVELDARYDGSSRFAKGNRWGFFPSLSLGWNITQEAFMEPITNVLSHLKIRASIGRLGNQAGAALYTFASTMSISSSLGNYIFADGRHNYLTAPLVVNPSTTWEKVDSKNLGIDFGLFGNSLTGSFDIFKRETKDMLGPGEDFPDFFGASAPQTNNAQMENRGWEFVLNYRGKIGRDIQYQIGGSVSDATSKVTEYSNPTGSDPANNWYVGKKVGEIWGYRTDGIIQTQEQADEYNRTHDNSYLTSREWTPGDVAFKDLNNDNKVNKGSNVLGDMGDYVIIGNSTPRYQYTINGSISWKGLSLSFMFQGVGKRDWSPNGVYFTGSSSYAQVTVFKEHMDYWTEDNPDAYYPKPYINTAGAVGSYNAKTLRYPTDQYLQNAAYCRLKNLTLSYDLPKAWVQKLSLQNVRVFFSGENLLTFTSLKGMFDPEEIYTYNDYTSEGGKNYPMNKVVSFGLSINL